LKTAGNPSTERPKLPSILVAFNHLFKAAGPLLPFALFVLRVLFLLPIQRALVRGGGGSFLRDIDRSLHRVKATLCSRMCAMA
jgi:hypothetical protein